MPRYGDSYSFLASTTPLTVSSDIDDIDELQLIGRCIGNTAGLEVIPECVDFAAEFASEHVLSLFESWIGCVGRAAVGLNAQAWPGFGSRDLISARLAMTTCFSPFLGVPLGSKFSVLSV